MTYDPSELQRLGKRAERLRAELADLQPRIAAEIRAARAAEYPLTQVIADSRYTRDGVYKILKGARGVSRKDDGDQVTDRSP